MKINSYRDAKGTWCARISTLPKLVRRSPNTPLKLTGAVSRGTAVGSIVSEYEVERHILGDLGIWSTTWLSRRINGDIRQVTRRTYGVKAGHIVISVERLDFRATRTQESFLRDAVPRS